MATAQFLKAPSSCEEVVFNTMGKPGQGITAVRLSGGFGNNSNCVTAIAFCLLEVPTQSLPVSPPPITTTFFAVAKISSSTSSLLTTLLFCCFKKSIAKCTPFNSLPGIYKSRGMVEPPAKTITLNSRNNSLMLISVPTLALHLKIMPSSSINFILRSITHFSSLKSGIP